MQMPTIVFWSHTSCTSCDYNLLAGLFSAQCGRQVNPRRSWKHKLSLANENSSWRFLTMNDKKPLQTFHTGPPIYKSIDSIVMELAGLLAQGRGGGSISSQISIPVNRCKGVPSSSIHLAWTNCPFLPPFPRPSLCFWVSHRTTTYLAFSAGATSSSCSIPSKRRPQSLRNICEPHHSVVNNSSQLKAKPVALRLLSTLAANTARRICIDGLALRSDAVPPLPALRSPTWGAAE